MTSIYLLRHGESFQIFFGHCDAAFRRAHPAAAHTSITHWRKEAGTERWVLECSNDRHHLDRLAGPC
jgi:2,3-bisphosphoglycerate-dependent phosphoglycerate mutase